jgi:hypothetical protein
LSIFIFKVLLAPLNYFSTIKFFFSKEFHLPIVANEVEMATMAPFRKLNTTRLGEINFEQKEGPIVIFFEVPKYSYLISREATQMARES